MNPNQTITLYQPVLQQIAYKILRCRADAEDIVQDTLARWLTIENKTIRDTKAYLIRSVRNNCLNHLRDLNKKKEEYLETLDLSKFKDKFKEIDFSHIDFESEMSKALIILHRKLQPLERAVYLLREVFDFDYATLQAALNKKQEHCRQLLSRAKRKLSHPSTEASVAKMDRDDWMAVFRKACEAGNPRKLVDFFKRESR